MLYECPVLDRRRGQILGAGVTDDCEMSAHLQEQKVLTAKLSCPPSRGPADKFLKHLMYSFHCEVDFRRCGAF